MSDRSKSKFQNKQAEKLYSSFAPDEVIDPGEGGGWLGLYLVPGRGGCILHEDTLGFVTIDCESDSGDIWMSWEERISEFDPSVQPDECDYVINSHWLVSQFGSNWIQHGSDLEDCERIIRERMAEESFLPNVWLVSERGEFQLHELGEQ